MKKLVLVLVLGLGLTSCEKEPIEKELTEVTYMGVGIGGNGFRYTEDWNGIVRDLSYSCVVKLKSCNGIDLEGFNFDEKLKINIKESDFPLRCKDTVYFKYKDILIVNPSGVYNCD